MKFAYKVVKKVDNNWRSVFYYKIPKRLEIIYKKGTVEASKGTLGIFCFKTQSQAKRFGSNSINSWETFAIFRVKPLSRGKSPKWIASILSSNIEDFYSDKNYYDFNPPIDGTICYQKIKVLEEIKL